MGIQWTPLYTDVSDIPAAAYQIDPNFSIYYRYRHYQFMVDDSNCTVLSNVATIGTLPFLYTLTTSDENCPGANDGRIEITINNSYGYNISYRLTYPDNTEVTSAAGLFTGLAPDTYQVYVISENNGVIVNISASGHQYGYTNCRCITYRCYLCARR